MINNKRNAIEAGIGCENYHGLTSEKDPLVYRCDDGGNPRTIVDFVGLIMPGSTFTYSDMLGHKKRETFHDAVVYGVVPGPGEFYSPMKK